jgi:hypothetical protein
MFGDNLEENAIKNKFLFMNKHQVQAVANEFG